MDPRFIAARLLGAITWQSEVSGFCRCPGESLHTHRTGPRDCRVNIDGAPTIYCFHSSCLPAVTEANRRLRRELNAFPWELRLPNGHTLRSGDLLQKDGTILPGRALGQSGSDPKGPFPGTGMNPSSERLLLESLRVAAERFAPDLFQKFHWPFDQILAESPLLVSKRDPEDQFRTWLKLWPAHSIVWVGEVFSSGKPEHATHFRPIADWYQIGPVMGNFTCGSSFRPGTYSRSNENLNGHRFLVVESDLLNRDQVGAVFAYLNRRLQFNLHAIIDTAGKSLHGWFSAPRSRFIEARLKTVLTVLGCDPKLFTYSQPVRVPGAFREGRLQRLVWLRQ